MQILDLRKTYASWIFKSAFYNLKCHLLQYSKDTSPPTTTLCKETNLRLFNIFLIKGINYLQHHVMDSYPKKFRANVCLFPRFPLSREWRWYAVARHPRVSGDPDKTQLWSMLRLNHWTTLICHFKIDSNRLSSLSPQKEVTNSSCEKKTIVGLTL